MKNKTWFITGTTQGFGLELVKQLLALGDNVAATTRDIDKLKKVMPSTSENFLPLQVDLLSEESIAAAVHATLNKFGAIDCLVNNAGYGILGGIEESTKQEVQSNFDINVFALLSVTRAVLPHMRNTGAGHIINMSSVFGLIAGPGWGIYCATKFAVEALSEALAEEVKPFGIKVTLIEPGYFRTNFLNAGAIVETATNIAAYTALTEVKRKNLVEMPGKQIGDPVKGAAVIIAIAGHEDAPLRLLLGSDALQYAKYKINMLEESMQLNEAISLSTDFKGSAILA